MSFRAEIKGIEELRRKLGGEIVDKCAAEAVRVGIFAGTQNIKSDAREYIATSDNGLTEEQRAAAAQLSAIKTGSNQLQVRTGRLQNSIQSTVESNGDGYVFTNVEYARIHELGGFAGRGGKVLIPARPYLLPALTKNMQSTLDFIKHEFVARIKQLGAK